MEPVLASAAGTEDAPLVAFLRQRSNDVRQLAVPTGASGAVPALPLLQNLPENPDAEARQHIVTALLSLSLQRSAGRPPKRFVQDELFVTSLIYSLLDPDHKVRAAASSYLAAHVLPSESQSNQVQLLIMAWPKDQSDALARVIAATGTVQAAALLKDLEGQGVRLPDEVRAKLGERGVEDRLLASFGGEMNAASKGEMALKLGYIGSSNAVLALTRELRSPLFVDGPNERYSLRYRILEALGRAMPYDVRFTEDLNFVTRAPLYGIKVDQEKYLDGIEAWAEGTLKMTWQSNRPAGPLWERKFVPHPLR